MSAAGAASAAAQAPQQTTATYSDWTVRCVMPEASQSKTCEMVQSANVKGQPNPISQVAIGRPSKTAAIKIVFQLPMNVWLPTSVRLIFDEKEGPVVATFKRCVPGSCFADVDLTDDQVKKMRTTKARGKVEFEEAERRMVTLPFSLNGFPQALDAMSKE